MCKWFMIYVNFDILKCKLILNCIGNYYVILMFILVKYVIYF